MVAKEKLILAQTLGKAQTSGPSISNQALYSWATALLLLPDSVDM